MTTRLEPVAWRVRANRNHPLVERDPFEWRLSETKPVLGEGAQVEGFDVQPLYAAAPAPDGMRADVLERLRALDFGGHYHEARFQQIADDILATIAKETK